jgi:hypothetical protein
MLCQEQPVGMSTAMHLAAATRLPQHLRCSPDSRRTIAGFRSCVRLRTWRRH